jgi:hypothetical protein
MVAVKITEPPSVEGLLEDATVSVGVAAATVLSEIVAGPLVTVPREAELALTVKGEAPYVCEAIVAVLTVWMMALDVTAL